MLCASWLMGSVLMAENFSCTAVSLSNVASLSCGCEAAATSCMAADDRIQNRTLVVYTGLTLSMTRRLLGK